MMNLEQTVIALRMLTDPRLPLEFSDVFTESILDARPGAPLLISEERLDVLANYIPDLVMRFRQAGTGA